MHTHAAGDALCLDCNYSLRGLHEHRCPECGRAFDPNDATTMNLGRPVGPVARALISRRPWPVWAAGTAICAWVVWRAAHPEFYYTEWLYWAAVMIVALPTLALCRMAAREITCTLLDQHWPGVWWRDWLNVSILTVVLVLVAWFQLPMRLGFWWARSDLEQMKASVDAGTPAATFVGRRVGPYRVHQVLVWPTGVMFGFTPNGDGFAKLTGPRLSYNRGADGHLSGDWHWYAPD